MLARKHALSENVAFVSAVVSPLRYDRPATEREEPILRVSATDVSAPNWQHFWTDKLSPRRTHLLTDMELEPTICPRALRAPTAPAVKIPDVLRSEPTTVEREAEIIPYTTKESQILVSVPSHVGLRTVRIDPRIPLMRILTSRLKLHCP